MSKTVRITVDGKEIEALEGQTILEACDAAGIYIPRLCYMKGLTPHGSCRICTVRCNGRPQAACTQPVADGMVIENDTPEIQEFRRSIVDMLFVEGNHFCMFCEKSGNCELQAMAYRLGILAPAYPFLFPEKSVDATHPDVFIDRNRCILCGRCVSASKEKDGKTVFEFTGRGIHKCVSVNSSIGAGGTNLESTDKAIDSCPVGALLRKRIGYAVPIGKRKYDHTPIGAEIESKEEVK